MRKLNFGQVRSQKEDFWGGWEGFFSPPQGVTFPLALVKSDFIIIFFPGLRERLSGLSSVLFGSQLPSFPASQLWAFGKEPWRRLLLFNIQ